LDSPYVGGWLARAAKIQTRRLLTMALVLFRITNYQNSFTTTPPVSTGIPSLRVECDGDPAESFWR